MALLDAASEQLLAADLGAMADWAASGIALDARPLAPDGGVSRSRMPLTTRVGWESSGATRLVSVLPAGHLLSVPEAAHFPHIEEPAIVLPAVIRHLT